jgi:putative ABC transport system permease protein
VITESIAKKIFGNEDPMGKSIEFPGGASMVTGIAYDYPANSHFYFDYLVPLHSIPFFEQENWVGFSTLTYIKLRKSASPDEFMAKIPDFIRQYADGQIRQRNGISYDEYIEAGNGYNYYLQPIEDIHLYSNIEGELKANGNINYIYIFSIIAVFILIIACINFMNLSTARSTERGKEVGIRKVLGSAKNQLVAQFLTESILITILSSGTAVLVTYSILPVFNDIAERPLNIEQIITPLSLLVIGIIVLVIGFIAGIYPAFFISSFAPVSVLKGKLKNSKSGIGLRNTLVVLQFAISIALISSTILVYNQMNYLLNKPLGFDEEQVVVIENAFQLQNDPNAQRLQWDRFQTFKTELNRIPEVISSGYTSSMPGDILPGYMVRVPGKGEKESMVARNMVFDYNLPETLSMEMIAGRFFSREFNDSLSMVLNESAVQKLGITNPVGSKILQINNDNTQDEYTIIGVVRDFHFQSLHVEMEPVCITSIDGQNQFLAKTAVKITGINVSGTLEAIKNKWDEFVPDSPFQSYFLDSDLQEFYRSEQATGRIFSLFTALAIIIACVGLLGLSAFVMNQRVKEIGVRKVLGATIPQIIMLLSKDFTKLIFIAAIIAIPASYYWMSGWLENFAYSVGISWIAFAIAGIMALAIGLATIGLQSIRAAIANPVNSLRDE